MAWRVGFLTTHPIQYQVPVFRHLAALPEVDLTVFYCQLPDAAARGADFGVAFDWDIPLLDGYRYEVLCNVARQPSVTRFTGCDTPEIGTRLRHGRFDAVIVNGWVVKSCLQTLWACKRLGIPRLVRGEANVVRSRPWWKRVIHRTLVRQYAACLYIGTSNAEFYRRHGVAEKRLFPALYFVDNERFARQSALAGTREAARERWGIPGEATVFLYCAKFIPKKHPLELLAALRLATATSQRPHLLMVGDGDPRPACEAYVREHGVSVTFAGFLNQSEIAAAYAAVDCLVLPSDHGETWGLVANEAMACGVPAIVSDQVGCGPDLIVAGETGFVFPFGDWPSLAKLLAELAERPEELRRQGQNARIRIAGYSVEAEARGTVAAVRAVVKQRCQRQPFAS